MKTASLFFLAFFFAVRLSAVDTTIIFSHSAYPAIFSEAKAQRKMVFLYFHFNGCGACIKMEKTTFLDADVARYFNERFINFEINTLEGEGIQINQTYQVKSHPTFMFLNSAGEVVHRIVGIFSPDEFIRHAETALQGTGTFQYYQDQYQKGNRDPQFLRECTYAMRDGGQIPLSLIDEYLQTQHGEQLKEEHNIRYIYEFAYHQHEPHVLFGSPPYQFMLDHQPLFDALFEPEQIDTRLIFIALHAGDKAIHQLDDTLFERVLEVLRQIPSYRNLFYKEMDGRATAVITESSLSKRLEVEFAKAKGEFSRAQRLTREMARAVWDDSDALNTMAWDRYQGKSSRSELREAISWIKRSIQLDRNYNNLDTYAALLYRVAQYKKSRRFAIQAIEVARLTGQPYEETEALLKKLEDNK